MDTKRNKDNTSEIASSTEPIRLSKLMAELGLCSRREADRYISEGLVFVDGRQVNELGIKFPRGVRIELAAQARKQQQDLVTILLNKPIGYVSSQPEPQYTPAIQLLGPENFDSGQAPPFNPRNLEGLAVAGRLDIDSQGLLIFTQDGRIAKKLIGENSEIEKEYLVRVSGSLSKEDLELLRFGLELDGKNLKPAHVEWLNQDQLRFVLKEGRKRQVRRMCEFVGLNVLGLKRVRVGRIPLGHLPEGKWRFLLPHEEF